MDDDHRAGTALHHLATSERAAAEAELDDPPHGVAERTVSDTFVGAVPDTDAPGNQSREASEGESDDAESDAASGASGVGDQGDEQPVSTGDGCGTEETDLTVANPLTGGSGSTESSTVEAGGIPVESGVSVEEPGVDSSDADEEIQDLAGNEYAEERPNGEGSDLGPEVSARPTVDGRQTSSNVPEDEDEADDAADDADDDAASDTVDDVADPRLSQDIAPGSEADATSDEIAPGSPMTPLIGERSDSPEPHEATRNAAVSDSPADLQSPRAKEPGFLRRRRGQVLRIVFAMLAIVAVAVPVNLWRQERLVRFEALSRVESLRTLEETLFGTYTQVSQEKADYVFRVPKYIVNRLGLSERELQDPLRSLYDLLSGGESQAEYASPPRDGAFFARDHASSRRFGSMFRTGNTHGMWKGQCGMGGGRIRREIFGRRRWFDHVAYKLGLRKRPWWRSGGRHRPYGHRLRRSMRKAYDGYRRSGWRGRFGSARPGGKASAWREAKRTLHHRLHRRWPGRRSAGLAGKPGYVAKGSGLHGDNALSWARRVARTRAR